jgi:hypothetical protein
MRRTILFLITLVISFSFVDVGWAPAYAADGLSDTTTVAKRSKKKKRSKKSRKPRKSYSNSRLDSADAALKKALSLSRSGNYLEASTMLFRMSRSSIHRHRKMQIQYILGLMLYKLGLNQVAAYQFVNVVKDGNSRYIKQSLEKLSLAADYLGDDTLLNYAMKKVKLNSFPRSQRDVLRFRIGEIQMRKADYNGAARSFGGVRSGSSVYSQAKYNQAAAYAHGGRLKKAYRVFSGLASQSAGKGITDTNRVAALMGMARTQYQMKKWNRSIELYREIPRDTEFWHDVLFEMSWAQLRAAKFRSVLSNFHSLHSAYYEDFYIPESLMLRAIVYLYICQFEEMEKTLELFEAIYKPLQQNMQRFLKAYRKPYSYYKEIAYVRKRYEDLKTDKKLRMGLKIPFLIARKIAKEGDVVRSFKYLDKLDKEQQVMNELPSSWQRSRLGRYAKRLLRRRAHKAKKILGAQIRDHMVGVRKELVTLFEQHGFARYEMIRGKKQLLKMKISRKGVLKKQVDQDADRDFYVQNGYEYWPYRGEYWLDEIGNYYYVGTQSCQ